MSLHHNHHDIRDGVIGLFEKLGLTNIQAKDLEIGIFNTTIEYAKDNGYIVTWQSDQFKEAYLTRARNLYANLKQDSYIHNTRLMQRLQENEFSPHELANMKNESIFPEKWSDIVDQELSRSKNAYELTEAAMTDQVTCGKCKKNKISYREIQIRSADEPSTHFFRCLVCGNRWKH